MPIKSLESYLFERKLVNTSSIEILQNATIGIDVEHYLSRIYTFKKEQFLSGIGGIPSSLKDYIQSDLQVFKEFNIKPVFIISGLGIQLQHNDYKTNELSPQEQHLENTWSKLNSKNQNPYGYNSLNNESFRLFTDPLPLRPMINDLIKYFIEINIDYMISPYDASFQLSYLYQNNVIDSIYGSTDLLLTKIDKFILGMEFQSKDFRFIDKFKILNELNLTEKQFVDLSIMVGCKVQPTTFPTFPPLPKPTPGQPYPQLSYFKLHLEMIYQYNSFNGNKSADLYPYIVGLNDPKLLDLYFRGHSALKFVPVLNMDGFVDLYSVEMAKLGLLDESDLIRNSGDENSAETKTDGETETDLDTTTKSKGRGKSENRSSVAANGAPDATKNIVKVPNNIHDIISQRLPPEIYFYQSIGLLRIEILESITQGQLNIRPPLESGLSDTYKKLISLPQYNKLLDIQFNLITQLLARYYQVKKIKVDYWFKDEVIELNNRLTPPFYQQVSHLVHTNSAPGDKFSLVKFFNNLGEEFKRGSVSNKDVKTNVDLISTVLLRNLYLLEIIDNKTNKLNLVGKILKTFTSKYGLEINETELQELVVILLLIKSKTIKLNEPNREYNGVPKFFKEFGNEDIKLVDDDMKHITLISRIFSLHKFKVSPINYQGPISRALINFRSHVKFVSNAVINNIECLLVDFIVHQENSTIKSKFNDKSDWYKLIDQLPFYNDCNNTLLGILAEIYFEYSIKQKHSSQELSKEEIIKNTKDHILNSVFQINNSSFNINVNGVNSITTNQLLRDLDNGIRFWSYFIKLVEIIHAEDSTLINDTYFESILETDKWLHEFV